MARGRKEIRTGKVKTLFDKLDLEIVTFIEDKKEVTIINLMNKLNMTRKNILTHIARLEKFLDIRKGGYNGLEKFISLNSEGKKLRSLFE